MMAHKCNPSAINYFNLAPKWLVIVQLDARRPVGFPYVPRRHRLAHTPRCQSRIRVRNGIYRALDTLDDFF
jgi:hypothetical protein